MAQLGLPSEGKDKEANHWRNYNERLREYNEEAMAGPVGFTGMNINEELQNPFITGGQQAQQSQPPQYNYQDLFRTPQIEMTDEPIRDAAQSERLSKMAKFNTLSKGLQLLFGGLVAGSGEVAPAPYDSPMTGLITQGFQNLDDKHFDELRRVRDQNLRAQMMNTEMQAQADRARINAMREDAYRLRQEGREDEAMAAEQALREAELALKQQQLALREEGQEADIALGKERLKADQVRNQNYQQGNKLQTLDAYDDAIQRESYLLRQLQENVADPEEIQAQQDKIRQISNERDVMLKQLAGKETFDPSAADQPPPQNVDQIKQTIQQGIQSGAYQKNPEALRDHLTNMYTLMGYNGAVVQQAVDRDMKGFGVDAQKEAPPKREDYDTETEYVIAQKKHNKSIEESAKDNYKSNSLSALDSAFADAVSGIDAESASEYANSFKKSPVQAAQTLLRRLRAQKSKETPQDVSGFGVYAGPQTADKTTQRIIALEKAIENYKIAQSK